MIRVGQNWERRIGFTGHGLGPGLILHSQGDNLGVPVIEFRYICFQLNQLVSAGSSGVPPVENKNNIAFISIIL